MRRRIIIGLIVVIPVFVIVLLVTGALRRPQPKVDPVTLTYWTVQDDESAFAEIIEKYRVSHPYITINVVKQRAENYDQALIQAWARGTGPDIFSIRNNEIGTYADLIAPLPDETSVYYYEIKQILLRKQLSKTKRTTASLTPARFGTDYIDVVPTDAVRNGKIYGLPLSMDSLVVYFNRDILNTADVVNPPTTWSGLVQQVSRLTLLDNQSNVIQSAIGLGRADNVAHSVDIISLLMLQNGTAMTDSSGRLVQFDRGLDDYNPGLRALSFYSDFTDPTKEVYTWTKQFSNSLDNFIEGKIAYFIGTLADRSTIDERGRQLNYDVAPMFHINEDGTDTNALTNARMKMNAASYWLETVAERSAHQNEAWNFIQFMSQSGNVSSYLEKTGRVSALRKNLSTQVGNQRLAVFASQAISTKSWYRGENWTETESALTEMINSVADKSAEPSEALARAAKRIQLTYFKSQ